MVYDGGSQLFYLAGVKREKLWLQEAPKEWVNFVRPVVLVQYSEPDSAFNLGIITVTKEDALDPRRNNRSNTELAKRHLKLGVKPLV
jgi:hypothetical protein